MMLRKFSFPSVALHSMMKQVSAGQVWEVDASSCIPEPGVCPGPAAPLGHSVPHRGFLFTAATIRSFSKVQVQHL